MRAEMFGQQKSSLFEGGGVFWSQGKQWQSLKCSDISATSNTIYERSLFVVRDMNLMSGLVTNYSAQGLDGADVEHTAAAHC